MLSLQNRIAIVTGASAGIGEAITRDLSAQGAFVVINARRADPLNKLVRELGESRAAAVVGDCADPAVIRAMLDTARTRFGNSSGGTGGGGGGGGTGGTGGGVVGGGREADLVVVNAGRGLNGSVMTSDTSQWEEMIRTNLLAAAHLIRESGHRMLKSTEGLAGEALVKHPRDIVVIGSTVGRHVSPFSSMYGSTKFGVHGLTEGARRELGPKGIRVSLIEPGFVKSEFQGVAGYDPKWVDGVFEKFGPVLTGSDVARVVTFIASQPPHVHVNDVMLRPTRQDYP